MQGTPTTRPLVRGDLYRVARKRNTLHGTQTDFVCDVRGVKKITINSIE